MEKKTIVEKILQSKFPESKLSNDINDELLEILTKKPFGVLDGSKNFNLYQMRTSRCFSNCELLMFQKEAKTYYEGIAMSEDKIWRHHAWCGIDKNKFIETTEKRLYYIPLLMKKVEEIAENSEEKISTNILCLAYIHDHVKGTSYKSYIIHDSVKEAQNELKEELLKRGNPECASHIKNRANANDSFISLIYPQNKKGRKTEIVMIYIQCDYLEAMKNLYGETVYLPAKKNEDGKFQICPEGFSEIIKKVVDEKIKEARLILEKFNFYDFCFMSESINDNIAVPSEAFFLDEFVFEINGKTEFSIFDLKTGKFAMMEADKYIMKDFPEIAPYFHSEASKFITTSKIGRKDHKTGNYIVKFKDALNVYLEYYGNFAQ